MVLCGIQASGKSTMAKRIAQETGANVYCCDEFYSSNQRELRENMSVFHAMMRSDLLNGRDVICDGMYVTEVTRRQLLNSVADIPVKKIILVLTTPFDVCKKRNAARDRSLPERYLHGTKNVYKPPALDEGWDEIREVKTDGSGFAGN